MSPKEELKAVAAVCVAALVVEIIFLLVVSELLWQTRYKHKVETLIQNKP